MMTSALPALSGAFAGALTPQAGTAAALEGALAVSTTGSAALSVDKPLVASCAISTSTTAQLTLDKPLAGGLSLALQTAGGFAFEGLQGTLAVAPIVEASLTAPIRIAGGLTVATTTSALLSLDKPLVGTLAAVVRSRGSIGGPGLVRATIQMGPRVSGSVIWVARSSAPTAWQPGTTATVAWRSRLPATVTFASGDTNG